MEQMTDQELIHESVRLLTFSIAAMIEGDYYTADSHILQVQLCASILKGKMIIKDIQNKDTVTLSDVETIHQAEDTIRNKPYYEGNES